MQNFRTDLAAEAKRVWEKTAEETTKLSGVAARRATHSCIAMEIVEILDAEGEQALNKPVGTYVTVDLDAFLCRERESFRKTAEAVSSVLQKMMPEADNVLVVGLGNSNITVDAIGPITLDNLIVTRHLMKADISAFRGFCNVSAVKPSVLGRTGMESAELVESAVKMVKPECVVVVDALASCEPDRLCASVQITDTGIVPGSGVGNHRMGFTKEILGVPVFAVGVPTVVDGGTFLALSGADVNRTGRHDLVLSCRDIDRHVNEIGRLLGYSLNLALQPRLTFHDIPGFLS